MLRHTARVCWWECGFFQSAKSCRYWNCRPHRNIADAIGGTWENLHRWSSEENRICIEERQTQFLPSPIFGEPTFCWNFLHRVRSFPEFFCRHPLKRQKWCCRGVACSLVWNPCPFLSIWVPLKLLKNWQIGVLQQGFFCFQNQVAIRKHQVLKSTLGCWAHSIF